MAEGFPSWVPEEQIPDWASRQAGQFPQMQQEAGMTPAPQSAGMPRMSQFPTSQMAPTVADLYPNPAMAQAFLKSRGYDIKRVAPWQVPLQDKELEHYGKQMKGQQEGWEAQRRVELLQQADRRQAEIERHNLKLEEARLAQERRAAMMEERRARAKPLPRGMSSDLQSATAMSEGANTQLGTFKDEYGGSYIMGGMENTLKRWFPSLEWMGNTVGQADWWSAMTGLDNIIRHPLFGSAFTPTEKRIWEETTVTPRDDPKLIRDNLSRRSVTLNRAMKRLVEAAGVNYDPREIEALTGMRPTTARRPPLDEIFGGRR